MLKDLNKVMLTGHLGADPEMRMTPQGNAVTTFRVASGRSWKSADGAAHEETEWFRIVAWNKLGEVCNQFLRKGSRVYVEGRMQTRTWTDDQGQQRWSTEIVASDMIMLSNRQSAVGAADVDGVGDDEFFDGDETPAPAPARPAAPAARSVPAAEPRYPAGVRVNGSPGAAAAQRAAATRPAARTPRYTDEEI